MVAPALIGKYSQVIDYADLEGSAANQLVLAAATATPSGPVVEGVYDVWALVGDVYVRVNAQGDATSVTAGNGYLLRAGNTITVYIRPGSQFNVLSVAGTTFVYHRTA